jgi:type IV fimbrial biogenesis protein FimT
MRVMNLRGTRAMSYRSQQHGFSLGELMIVVAIVAVMATIAVPSLASFVNQTRLNSVRSLLMNDINTARSEAIKNNTRMAICAANTAGTNCAASTNWALNGWLICVALGAGCDTTASAVVVRPAAGNGVVMTSGSTNAVIFRPIGSAVTAEQVALSGKTGAQSGVVSIATTGFVSYLKN